MTDKDPKDMTASELLRLADSHPCSMCHLVMAGDESCATTGCASWAYRLADKIDAELAQARELSLLRGAELWAKANGWPDFREGEDFGAWLDRCFLPRPRFEDGEVVGVREYEDIQGYCVYDDGEFFITTPNRSIDYAAGERVERPAPEALGADGLPIVEGETVYPIDSEWLDTPLEVLSVESLSVKVSLPSGKGWTMFRADRLTHTPPETQERIDDDATMPPAKYCAVRGIDLGDDPDWETATVAMVRDLLRRQRELDKRTGGE